MSDLPLPVRLAAGLAVLALEQARTFPKQLAGLPMTVASRALQASMRAQQQLTELAIKGDAVFAQLRPVEEEPAWAHFDEDDDFGDPFTGGTSVNGTADLDIGADDSELTAAVLAPKPSARAAKPAEAESEPAPPAAAPEPAADPTAEAATVADPAADPAANGAALDGYSDLSLAQLRGKLRSLSLPELELLLEYENTHAQRAAFVTMLANRITTVRSK